MTTQTVKNKFLSLSLSLFLSLVLSSSFVFAKNYILLDESVESPPRVSTNNWVVDRYTGNTKAGTVFYQGAAREVGGAYGSYKAVETPEGVYIVGGTMYSVENVPLYLVQNGTLRLLMESQGDMEGPIELCQGGYPVWSEFDNSLYLVGPGCLRKINVSKDGQRTVQIVAGKCFELDSVDGAALTEARLQRSKGVAAASDGTIYWLERYALRKIKGGQVSTVTLTWSGRPETEKMPYWSLPRNLYDDNLSMGEDDNTLYINDYYDTAHGYGVLKADLTPGVMTIEKIIGNKGSIIRANWNGTEYEDGTLHDGHPRQQMSFRGGGAGRYHQFYNALLLDGNDNGRYRWYKLNGTGNVTTIFGTPINKTISPSVTVDLLNSLRIPGERFYHSGVVRFVGDGRGEGIYVFASFANSGLFRAYDTTKTNGAQYFPDTYVPSSRDARAYAILLKPDGTPLSTQFQISPLGQGVQTQPKVAYHNGIYLVVWAQLSGEDFNVMGVRIDSNGKVLDSTPIIIDNRPRTQTMPDVAADDSGFMVVWGGFEGTEKYPNVYASRVKLTGSIDPSYPKKLAIGASPEIAWSESADKFLVVYASGTNGRPKTNAWMMIDENATVLPANEQKPYFHGARSPQFFSVSALPDSGGNLHGWTFMLDQDIFYNFYVIGVYRAITIAPNGTYDAGMSGLNAPWPYKYQTYGMPEWFVDHKKNLKDTNQWPKGQSALATDKDYVIAVWSRFDRDRSGGGFQMYNSDLYIGRLNKFDLVETSPVILANSTYSERNPSIAGDKNENLVVVYEKILEGERQIASKLVGTTGGVSLGPENIIASSGDLWRGYPDIGYNMDDNNYLMVWQEGWHGMSYFTYPEDVNDTTPPSTPVKLKYTYKTSRKVSLNWTESTDNIRVMGYKIYRDSVLVGTSFGNSFTDTGLSPGTQYSYRVSAIDSLNNEGGLSTSIVVTTNVPEQ